MLNSQRIFGTCQHFSTKCKEVKEKESLAEKYFFDIIDKNNNGERRKKINVVSFLKEAKWLTGQSELWWRAGAS